MYTLIFFLCDTKHSAINTITIFFLQHKLFDLPQKILSQNAPKIEKPLVCTQGCFICVCFVLRFKAWNKQWFLNTENESGVTDIHIYCKNSTIAGYSFKYVLVLLQMLMREKRCTYAFTHHLEL
jgi:hypothetical protein